MISHSSSRVCGSRPALGSSRNSTCGSCIMARAIETRCIMPPENPRTSWSARSVSLKRSSRSLARRVALVRTQAEVCSVERAESRARSARNPDSGAVPPLRSAAWPPSGRAKHRARQPKQFRWSGARASSGCRRWWIFRSVRAEEAKNLPRSNVEVDAVKRDDLRLRILAALARTGRIASSCAGRRSGVINLAQVLRANCGFHSNFLAEKCSGESTVPERQILCPGVYLATRRNPKLVRA